MRRERARETVAVYWFLFAVQTQEKRDSLYLGEGDRERLTPQTAFGMTKWEFSAGWTSVRERAAGVTPGIGSSMELA
jgi:hypothetical protein